MPMRPGRVGGWGGEGGGEGGGEWGEPLADTEIMSLCFHWLSTGATNLYLFLYMHSYSTTTYSLIQH